MTDRALTLAGQGHATRESLDGAAKLIGLDPDAARGDEAAQVRSLRLQVFRTFSEAEAVWRSAEERCPCHVFQSYDWLSTWQETIGAAEGVKPVIVHVADRHGETAMLWPLGIRRRHGLSFLCFLGGVVTDYHAPLIVPGSDIVNQTALAALMPRVLAAIPHVDVIAFERMPASIGEVGNPVAGLPGTRHVWSAHLAQLPPSFDAFKRARSSKLFSDAARRWRLLSQRGEPRITLSPEPDARAAILVALAAQKSRRWRETGATDLFALPGYLSFYRMLVDKFYASGLVHVSALTVADAIVATHLGAVFRGRFYYLMPSYEAGDWSRFSVGRQLLQRLVEWSIAAGLKEFDFTVGDEAYKAEWADSTMPLYDYTRGVSIRGRAFCFGDRTIERLKSQAKKSERLRDIVRSVRSRRLNKRLFGSRANDPKRGIGQ